MSAIHRTALRWKLLSKVWENHWGLPRALVSTRSIRAPARIRAIQYRPGSASNQREAGRELGAGAAAGASEGLPAAWGAGRAAGRSARPVRASSRCAAPSTRASSSPASRGIHSAQRSPRWGAAIALTATTATETAGDRARASKPRTRTASVTSSPGITRMAAHRMMEGTRLSQAMGCGLRFRGVPSGPGGSALGGRRAQLGRQGRRCGEGPGAPTGVGPGPRLIPTTLPRAAGCLRGAGPVQCSPVLRPVRAPDAEAGARCRLPGRTVRPAGSRSGRTSRAGGPGRAS